MSEPVTFRVLRNDLAVLEDAEVGARAAGHFSGCKADRADVLVGIICLAQRLPVRKKASRDACP